MPASLPRNALTCLPSGKVISILVSVIISALPSSFIVLMSYLNSMLPRSTKTKSLLAATAAFAADDIGAMKQLAATNWIVPGIALEMKRIPAGTFTMGSPENEKGRKPDEAPQRKVKIAPFWMGVRSYVERV